MRGGDRNYRSGEGLQRPSAELFQRGSDERNAWSARALLEAANPPAQCETGQCETAQYETGQCASPTVACRTRPRFGLGAVRTLLLTAATWGALSLPCWVPNAWAGRVQHGSFGAPTVCSTPAQESSPELAEEIKLRSCDRWLEISTREVPCGGGSLQQCRFAAAAPGRPLRPASLAHFQQEYVQRPTLMYVHGYDNNAEDARKSAVEIYQYVRQAAHCPPLNVVVWSWPSDRQGIRIVDARLKAERSDFEAKLFSRFLELDSAGQPVSLVAFSLGARVVAGGLQQQAAASSEHHRQLAASRHPVQVLFVAGAIDRQWMLPGGRYGLATSASNRLINLVNHRDPALRRYHLITQQRQSAAVGAEGVPSVFRGGAVVSQCDVTAEVGRTHRLTNYLKSPKVVAQLRQLLIPVATRSWSSTEMESSTVEVSHVDPTLESRPETGLQAGTQPELGSEPELGSRRESETLPEPESELESGPELEPELELDVPADSVLELTPSPL